MTDAAERLTEVEDMPKKTQRKALVVEQIAAPPVPMDETTALISMLERIARDPSVDLDRADRALRMHAEASERRARQRFLADFSLLQSELPAAERKGTAHNNKRYARFEDIIAAVRPVLAKHGFSLSFRTQHEDKVIRVVGVLGHRDGHEERTDLPLPADTSGAKNAVQAWGSAISYGKRYVALTLLGIATTDDDDGQAAGTGETISDDQAMAIVDLLEATGSDRKSFLAYFKIDTIAALPARDFDRAMGALRKKAGAQ